MNDCYDFLKSIDSEIEIDDLMQGECDSPVTINDVPLEFVERIGHPNDDSGCGCECLTILKLGKKYYQFAYTYYSHCGYDYTDMYMTEVTRTEKTVNVYTAKGY